MENKQTVSCPYCGYKTRTSVHENETKSQVRCDRCKREIRTKDIK